MGRKLFICLLFIGVLLNSQDRLTFTAIKGSSYTKYATEVMTEAYRRVGIEIEITPLPGTRALVTANNGDDADGELFRISGVEREYSNLLPIKIPLSLSYWQVYTIDKDFVVDGWLSLKPYVIGVRNGIATTEYGTEGMNTIKVNSNEQLFELLEKGRVDVIVLSKNNATKVLSNNPDIEVTLLDNPVEILPVYHYLHKKNSELVPLLTAVLDDMERDGTIEAIFNKNN